MTADTLWHYAVNHGIDRRYFLQLLAAGGAAAVLNACKGSDMTEVKQPDCTIIGSGPVGIAVAIRIAEAGYSVVVLEAGSALTSPPGSHFRNAPEFRKSPDSYFGAIAPHLTPVGKQPNSLPGLADTALLGGQGVIWTNNCPRAVEFERWDVFSADEWDLRFAQAEKMLLVESYPLHVSSTQVAIAAQLRQKLDNDRIVETFRISGKIDDQGEIYFNSPWDMLDSVPTEVRNRIELRPETDVTKIVWKEEQVSALVVRDGQGSESQIEVSKLLLAGGAIGSPRLLHNSGIRPTALGKGFSFHALFFGQAVLNEELITSDHVLPHRLWVPPTQAKPWHTQILRDTFPVPTTELIERPERLIEFQTFLPVENRIENELRFTDEGELLVTFDFSDQDQEQMQAIEADVENMVNAIGRWRGGGEPSWVPQGTAHLSGTCRMDRAGMKGVTDADGRVHGFENLFLASVGMIPSPVAVNPTLTTVAFALRTADAILESIR